MIPTLFLFDVHLGMERFSNPVYLFNMIFLSLGASALCFVSWNFAVKTLGAVKTSVYIYMVPVITVVTSALILHETITSLSIVGTFLTLTGLFLSECKFSVSKVPSQEIKTHPNKSEFRNSHLASIFQQKPRPAIGSSLNSRARSCTLMACCYCNSCFKSSSGMVIGAIPKFSTR